MQTPIGTILKRQKSLFEAVVWVKSIDGNLRRMILNWVQNDQLREKGIDEDGNVIGYYSLATSLINPDKSFNTHFTLEDTGEFFQKMFVIALADSLVIDSDGADKTGDNGSVNLFTEYGEGITGLTDENMDKLVVAIRRRYLILVREHMGLN